MNIYEKELKHNGINSEKYGSVYEKELKHYGVLGMKWGVRRYQNADGSLTDAGKFRYGYKALFEKDPMASEDFTLKKRK